MPEITIQIGGRDFEVVCKSGEEDFLQSAAAMLDVEATALNTAMGRIPESRMLLMSGLMLADKTASLEDQLAASARENEGGQIAHEVSAEMDKLKADLAAANDKVDAAEKALIEKTARFEDQLAVASRENEEAQRANEVSADVDKLKADLIAANEKITTAEKTLAERTAEVEAKSAEVTTKTTEAEDAGANLQLALEAMERMVSTLEEKSA